MSKLILVNKLQQISNEGRIMTMKIDCKFLAKIVE